MYNPNIHHRRSIRLKNYDYSKKGLYFITLCATKRKSIFGEITNGEMHLNTFGLITDEEWKNTSEIRKNISLGEYIIMPNHFHAIISIDYKIEKSESDTGVLQYAQNEGNAQKSSGFKSPSHTIGAIIRGFKGATTKRINNLIRELKEKFPSTGELPFAPTRNLAPTGDSSPTGNSPLKKINLPGEGSIWQRNYYEHIIKSAEAYNNISNYIRNNPKNWNKDKFK